MGPADFPRSFLHLLLYASPIDLTPSLYLLSNHLLPSYLPSELGIGSQILTKAVQEVSGLQPRDLKKLWEKWGDPGDVAYEAKSNLRTLVKPSPLLVGDVYQRMLGLSRIKGSQSGRIKSDVVRKLMVQARGEEVRFLVRSLVGNLRVGPASDTRAAWDADSGSDRSCQIGKYHREAVFCKVDRRDADERLDSAYIAGARHCFVPHAKTPRRHGPSYTHRAAKGKGQAGHQAQSRAGPGQGRNREPMSRSGASRAEGLRPAPKLW